MILTGTIHHGAPVAAANGHKSHCSGYSVPGWGSA